LDREDIKHIIQQVAVVLFGLNAPIQEAQFNSVIDLLGAAAGGFDTAATPAEHWQALQRRMEGRARWDTLVSRVPVELTGEALKRLKASMHSVENILRVFPFTACTLDDVQYVVDGCS
jgi:hypothetical protein